MSAPKAVIGSVLHDDKSIVITCSNGAATVSVSIDRAATTCTPAQIEAGCLADFSAVDDLLVEMPYIIAQKLTSRDGAA